MDKMRGGGQKMAKFCPRSYWIPPYNHFPVGKSWIPIEILLKKAVDFAKHFCMKIAAYQNVSFVLVRLIVGILTSYVSLEQWRLWNFKLVCSKLNCILYEIKETTFFQIFEKHWEMGLGRQPLLLSWIFKVGSVLVE